MKSLLKHVPEEIVEKVYLIDLKDDEHSPGINLLDARIFPDRDRTTDSVVRISKGLWDQWGPRMQSILEHTVKSLHEYNTHPDTGEDEQCTILDGLRLLSDLKYRKRVLRRVSDPYVLGWWARDFRSWTRTLKADAVAPVQTRLAYYASSKKARAILGQRRSTLDLRQVIAEGGVLLVATSQSAAGQDVSALVGASLLNLTDAVIREQGRLSPDERRGALVVVDEMQSMPGVDYESMLSELGKFGASFILATQSLARLKELSPTMRDTLLANVGCLAVFQVAAPDARQLIGELDRERLDEEDLVSLPTHHCYVRATVDGLRQPTTPWGCGSPRRGVLPLRIGYWRAPRRTPPRRRSSPPRTLRSSGWRRSFVRSWNGKRSSSRRSPPRLLPAPAMERRASPAGRKRSRARGAGERVWTDPARPAAARQRVDEGEGTRAAGPAHAGGHALPGLPGVGRRIRHGREHGPPRPGPPLAGRPCGLYPPLLSPDRHHSPLVRHR